MEKLDKDSGRLEIRLAELIDKKGLNRNHVAIEAAMNWKQVDKYCNNSISHTTNICFCF